MFSWFAVSLQGAALRVSALGLLIGRAPTCDLVLDEPEVSRRHVLLQLGVRGQLEIVPFLGALTTVNGAVLSSPVPARDGDVLVFPGGASVRLAVRAGDVRPSAVREWLLAVNGRCIGLRRANVVLGGGDDDVMIEKWPPAAAALMWRDDQPYFVPHIEGFARGGAVLPPPIAGAFAPGDHISHSGCALEGDLNQLVFRLRLDLEAAGMRPLELIERYAKGGVARFLVDASVSIQVRT